MDQLIAGWAGLGVAFDAEPADDDIDLERLLLDTARHVPQMARLLIMAVTWLNIYGDLVAKHRLKRLVRDELEPEYRPILGLMLDLAQQGTHPLEFETVIRQLEPATELKPLFLTARGNARLAQLAKRRASETSRKWHLWCQPFDFKHDAIRPAEWMFKRNPHLLTRADFRGDLRASILASLRHDDQAGQSESQLARIAGGSRAQTRAALRNLEMTGRVKSKSAVSANRRGLVLTDRESRRSV